MTALDYLFIIALLIFAFSIILMDARILIAQLILFSGFFVTNGSTPGMAVFVLGILQASLLLVSLIRCKKAVDHDYCLVLEKTHKIPRKLTKGGNPRGEHAYFKKSY